MSDESPETFGQVVLRWWGQNLRPPDDTGSARALRARLRRAGKVSEVLAHRPVIDLYKALPGRPSLETVSALAQVMANVERHEKRRLACALGAGEAAALSPNRFQRLVRSKSREELATGLRRALPMIGHTCNVAALAEDIAFWGEKTRTNWCLDYFGGKRPNEGSAEEDSK